MNMWMYTHTHTFIKRHVKECSQQLENGSIRVYINRIVRKLQYIHTIEYYSATERSKSTESHSNLDESQKHHTEGKKYHT